MRRISISLLCPKVSTWTAKPCQRCGGRKGPKYIDRKVCGRCAPKVAKEASDRAHRTSVAALYNIEPGDYDGLYAHQVGRCAICRRATGKRRRLSVDHDHASGQVRGLLCRPCNNMLGHARDDPEFFWTAYRYLLCPPWTEYARR